MTRDDQTDTRTKADTAFELDFRVKTLKDEAEYDRACGRTSVGTAGDESGV